MNQRIISLWYKLPNFLILLKLWFWYMRMLLTQKQIRQTIVNKTRIWSRKTIIMSFERFSTAIFTHFQRPSCVIFHLATLLVSTSGIIDLGIWQPFTPMLGWMLSKLKPADVEPTIVSLFMQIRLDQSQGNVIIQTNIYNYHKNGKNRIKFFRSF